MFEKVNPSHPDKVADRIAGAIVDLCYTKSRNRWSNESSAKLDLSTAEGRQRWAQANPKVACEVLIGHQECNIQVETSEQISAEDCGAIVSRIAGEGIETRALIVPQAIPLPILARVRPSDMGGLERESAFRGGQRAGSARGLQCLLHPWRERLAGDHRATLAHGTAHQRTRQAEYVCLWWR